MQDSGGVPVILSDFSCARHGVFELLADASAESVACPKCSAISRWVPSPIRFKVAISATRGNHDKPEHKGWLDTSNLEEGQSYDDWHDDREAVHEELRKDLVTEMVRSDR
jgi:hypothetical protein